MLPYAARLPRRLRNLDNFNLLLLDDLGYLPQGADECEVLFTFIAERYERRSLGITSNLVFLERERIFDNPMATATAIDRKAIYGQPGQDNPATGPAEADVMTRVVSWNIAMRPQAVEELLAMDPDVALLQEVGPGALEALKEAGGNVAVSPQDPWEPWPREHYDRWPMVVKLSDRVEVQWFRQVLPTTPEADRGMYKFVDLEGKRSSGTFSILNRPHAYPL